MPCSSPLARLAAPRASNSRLAFSVSPRCRASARMLPQDSANSSTTRPTASSATRSQASRPRSGRCGAKPGAATVPTISTPALRRSSSRVAMMAATRAISEAGQLGQRRSQAISPPAARATSRLGSCHSAAWASTQASSCSTARPGGGCRPSTSGNWRITMVTASANAKPRSTGRDTKADSWPCRAAASASSTAPAANVSASRASVGAMPARPAAAAAARLALDEVGATMASRLRPSRA
mmetsp:Transcript_10617/g.43467  ORF Transcript_10617/g.43467 Transcript_10617/m.43467 type:complete len:239 (-) Transcript_10617:282-998(-)